MPKERYQDPVFRREILRRDNYTCQMCDKKKKKLQVHHIKPWAKATYLRFDRNNCITLCSSCHYSIRGKEHHYEKLFYMKIGNKK